MKLSETQVNFFNTFGYLSRHSPGCHDHDTGAGMFYPTMVDTAGEERRVHLRQCGQMHDQLFPQFARQG